MTFAVVCAIDETDVKLLSSKPAASQTEAQYNLNWTHYDIFVPAMLCFLPLKSDVIY